MTIKFGETDITSVYLGSALISSSYAIGYEEGSTVSAYTPTRWLTFTSDSKNCLSMLNYGGNLPVLYYSYDASTWYIWGYKNLKFDSTTPLYIAGQNTTISTSSSAYSIFCMSGAGNVSCSGDIMSLLGNTTETLQPYCFFNLFAHCIKLVNAPELTATTLAESCYNGMFRNCYGLTETPEFPATTLANYCYNAMFVNCKGLVKAKNLNCLDLAEYCYAAMFYGCENLVCPPELPATTLESDCYHNMFSGCKSLTKAPELLAQNLRYHCYAGMFYGCSSLSYIKAMFTTYPVATYTYNWVNGVASSGVFIKSNSWASEFHNDKVPTGWATENGELDAIKVVSFNIRRDASGDGGIKAWSYRKDAVVKSIESIYPDICGLQESTLSQAEYILSGLSGYEYIGADCETGTTTDAGKRNSIFYNTATIELSDWGTFWFSPTPDVPSTGWADGSGYATATWMKCSYTDTGDNIFFINVHLDAFNKINRTNGIQLLISKISQLNTDSNPVVIVGDFNETIPSLIYNDIDSEYDNIRNISSTTDSLTTYNGFGGAHAIIDHIYSFGFTPIYYRSFTEWVDGIQYPSDHYPICSLLRID